MEKFDRSDEGSAEPVRLPSDRLQAFTQKLWEALVPDSGACRSVQGELVRAKGRLESEHFRNGMCNYFHRDDEGASFADTHYGGMAVFLLDTLIANRGGALDDEEIAWFTEARRTIEARWLDGLRAYALTDKSNEEELTAEEAAELERLESRPWGPDWDDFFHRAERAIANWCLTNTALVDREGRPVEEGGVKDVVHLFEPPPAPAPCALCNGKGWVAAKTASDFPAVCSCRQAPGFKR